MNMEGRGDDDLTAHITSFFFYRALERHPEALAFPALTLLKDALLDPILAPDNATNNTAGGGLVRFRIT